MRWWVVEGNRENRPKYALGLKIKVAKMGSVVLWWQVRIS
jgi:hypothetical protein